MAATETLDTRLRTWARETPRQTFLVSPETRRTLSYGELHDFRQRLAAHYDDRASLTLDNLEPEGVCATLSLPCAY